MNERYKDTDLREALRRKYADVPELPADFMASMNERLQAKPVAKTRRLWSWVAAACIAAIMVVLLMPPRESPDTVEQLPTAKLDAQPLPSLVGEGLGVGSVSLSAAVLKLQTPPPAPPLEGRGAAAHPVWQSATALPYPATLLAASRERP